MFTWYLATCSFFDELKVSTNLALETFPFHVVLRVRGASSSRITILSRRKSEAAQLPREPLSPSVDNEAHTLKLTIRGGEGIIERRRRRPDLL